VPEPKIGRIRRLAYQSVATWPRQLVWVILIGQPFAWLLDDVLNGAECGEALADLGRRRHGVRQGEPQRREGHQYDPVSPPTEPRS